MQLNEFGSITKITQGGLSEYRYYDNYQRLCQSYRADTGKTVYEYNAFEQEAVLVTNDKAFYHLENYLALADWTQ